jgi:hypothetical protein
MRSVGSEPKLPQQTRSSTIPAALIPAPVAQMGMIDLWRRHRVPAPNCSHPLAPKLQACWRPSWWALVNLQVACSLVPKFCVCALDVSSASNCIFFLNGCFLHHLYLLGRIIWVQSPGHTNIHTQKYTCTHQHTHTQKYTLMSIIPWISVILGGGGGKSS